MLFRRTSSVDYLRMSFDGELCKLVPRLLSNPPLQQKKKTLEDDSKTARPPQKQTAASPRSSSLPQIIAGLRNLQLCPINLSTESKHHPKKKQAPRNDPFIEEDDEKVGMDFRSTIRQMYGYDPNRYRDEYDDVSNMEVGFHTILKEEKGSSKVARELRLIEEEEERRERMKKKSKKGKL